jgi:hypothetical protein
VIILTNTGTDKLQLTTGSAATLDVNASWIDLASNGSGDPTPGRTNTAITTATTTDIVATPASSTVRNVKELNVRNKHASQATDVTVVYNQNGTSFELHKANLAAGEAIEYIEGIGWFEIAASLGLASANYSTTAQTPTAATLTQLAGSTITVPTAKLRIGTMFRWFFDITKTAAGTATSAYHVRIGTANTTGDTAVLTFTKPLGTAVIDTGIIEIHAVVRGPLSASCILAGVFEMRHNLASTGHNTTPATATPATIITVSSGFDATAAGLFVSLSCTTGSADAITTQVMMAEVINL